MVSRQSAYISKSDQRIGADALNISFPPVGVDAYSLIAQVCVRATDFDVPSQALVPAAHPWDSWIPPNEQGEGGGGSRVGAEGAQI